MSFAASLVASGIKSYLNKTYARYGEVRSLELDLAGRALDADVLLAGEESPVRVRAAYTLAPNDLGDMALRLHEASFSRPWMQALYDDRCPEGLTLRLPAQAALLLGRVMT